MISRLANRAGYREQGLKESLMKLGFMTFINPEWSMKEHVEAAQRHGYTGIEPRSEAKHNHGIELDTPDAELAELRRMVEGEGLDLCCVATSRRYSMDDEAERKESVELTKRYVELAAKVGAPCLRVFGGMLPDGVHVYTGVDYMSRALREVGEFAADYPVSVCLETHDGWCSTYRLMELIRRVDHPSIQVNYDYTHCKREFEPAYESYMHLRPWVKHCHMHDYIITIEGKTEFANPGEGLAPQLTVMECLKADNYTGYFSLEVMGRDPDETMAAYAKWFNECLEMIS